MTVPRAATQVLRPLPPPNAFGVEHGLDAAAQRATPELPCAKRRRCPRQPREDDARFRDRTMTWFRAGEELEQQETSTEYEAFRMSRTRLIALSVLASAALVAIVGVAIGG